MQPYLSGRKQANTSGGQPSDGDSPLSKVHAPSKAPHSSHGTPEVECVKQGNRVTRILVTCGCGERIEIDCVYPEES